LMLVQLACGFGVNAPSSPAASSGGQTEPAPISPPLAGTSERGTPADAQAMLQLALEHFNQVGRDQAYADFNAGQPPFKDRDLYVACIAQDHTEPVNGGFPQYIGSSADLVIAENGKPVGQAVWDAVAVSENGIGEVSYQWVNPVSGTTERKTLFAQKFGDDVCGVGAYNP